MCVEVDETSPAQREPLASNGSVDDDQSLVVVLDNRHGDLVYV